MGLTPHELIRKLVAESRPEGGSMFLEDFCEQCPGVPRAECVHVLKNSRDVLFIVGRKGHQSRVIFGRMKEHYGDAPSFKSPAASGPIRPQYNTSRRRVMSHKSPVVLNGTDIDVTKFRLRVVVQGQEVFVPVDQIELVPIN